jgi:glyoxalase family protein
MLPASDPFGEVVMQLTGIHHLTAISANAPGNLRFYRDVLGMRLVKKTVNQDDVSAYHLFYADAVGSPGSDITFFDWPAPREQRGSHSISRTGLRVQGEASLQWWREHLRGAGIQTGDIVKRDGRMTLDFEDPEGQRLSLIDDGGHGEAHPWDRSLVPAAHQIRGLGPVTLSVPELAPTETVLTQVMNMRKVRDYPHPQNARHRVHVFEMGEGGTPAAELHIGVEPDVPEHRQGAGGVHHVAFRVPTFDDYDAWAERLNAMHVSNSGKIDRFWFRSLYFREPNGVLFELATDPPGFATDEPIDKLGETLSLPPFLEARRSEIEANLKPL